MPIRKFNINIEASCTIELDDAVINAVDDEWRKQIYNFKTPEEIAAHIAYNLVVNNAKLTELDGWADQKDSMAKVSEPTWEFDATEIKSR